jgi:hypothetical protein
MPGNGGSDLAGAANDNSHRNTLGGLLTLHHMELSLNSTLFLDTAHTTT